MRDCEDKLNKAIKELETFKIMAKSESGEMAITMAIEALKREPVNKLTQQAYEDGKKDGYFQAKADQILKTSWIPVSERMPEEHEWIGTKRFGTTKSDEVYVTFETPEGDRFTKHLSFQNGKLSIADQQIIDVIYKGSIPVAWMPLPDAYIPETE